MATVAEVVLDRDAILGATEDVLRRDGPARATVVDVARALGVSHAAVYRHFPSKQALREAVTRRWLDAARDEFAAVADDTELAPPERLRAWLQVVLAVKRDRARDEPELFAAFALLARENSSVATDHVAALLGQLGQIVTAGAADGSFTTNDPAATARTVYTATTRFHDLAHAASWQEPDATRDLDAVCSLLLAGLRAPAPTPRKD